MMLNKKRIVLTDNYVVEVLNKYLHGGSYP